MTPHGKAHDHSHYSFPPKYTGASARRRVPVEAALYDSFVANEKKIRCRNFPCDSGARAHKHGEGTRLTSRTIRSQLSREAGDTARRCACARQARSTGVRGVGGVVASCPNRARCRRCGLGEREEIHFFEISSEKNFPRLGASASNCSASTSPASRSRRKPAAPRARLISTSTAQPRLPTKRSWSCWTNYAPGSGLNFRRQDPTAVAMAGSGSPSNAMAEISPATMFDGRRAA